MRIGLTALMASLALAGCQDKAIDDRPWALPIFQFIETGNDGSDVFITGTLKGDDVAYKDNTWSIHCARDEKVCHMADVEEIGKDHLGDITMNDWDIVTWTPTTIVTQDEIVETGQCAQNTITINRVAKTVAYDSIAKNSDKDYCKRFHKPVDYHWTIGQPKQPWEK